MTKELRSVLSSWPPGSTTLHWSLRESFTEYIHSIDDGRVTTDQVATDESGRFVFAEGERRDPRMLAYRGTVHFWAHFGVLNFRVADLVLDLSDEPHITIAAQPRERERATIGLLVGPGDISGDRFSINVALTDDGVRLLGGVYSVGDALDPLHILRSRPSDG